MKSQMKSQQKSQMKSQMTSQQKSQQKRQQDLRFGKLLVVTNAVVPGAILAWDAAHGQIGVNGVNYALHTTGLLALIFLLLTLLVTPLRKLTGWNRVLAFRRSLGLVGFAYACVHFLIFFGLDRALSVSSTVHEILTRRYLVVGTLGLLSLVPLAVTSTNGMVMRLGARRWKALHRLSYVAAAAGALHYYMLVKSDVRQPLVFAAALTVLLGYRVVRALLGSTRKAVAPADTKPRFWSGTLRVAQIVDEAPDVRTFRLVGEVGDDGRPLPFEHQPGQYLTLAMTIEGRRVKRSFTIASSPTQRNHCEVTVRRNPGGQGSRYLHDQVRVGAQLQVSAPAGRFVFTGSEAARVILIAGGVGITPLMSIVRYLTDRAWGGAIYLLIAAKTQADLIFAEELAQLGRRFANLHVFQTLSREGEVREDVGEGKGSSWTGERGHISRELLERFVPDVARGPVYLCGPDGMMAALRVLLLEMGLPESELRTEAFVSGGAAAPGQAGSTASTASTASTEAAGSIHFARSRRLVEPSPGKSILEVAEDAGIDLPFECRSGICGQCKTKLVSGQVIMETEDALSPSEKARGFILACQAHPAGDVTVEA